MKNINLNLTEYEADTIRMALRRYWHSLTNDNGEAEDARLQLRADTAYELMCKVAETSSN